MIPQNVDECFADPFASVHYAENRFVDPQSPLEKVLQHRGAHPRVLRRAQPYTQETFVPSIVIRELRRRSVRPPQGHPSLEAASSNSSSLRDRYSSSFGRLAHEVTAGGTLARATRLQLRRGFVQTRFVISGRYPHQDLVQHYAPEAGLLRGRLRSVEATPRRPTSNELEVATLGFDDRRSSAPHPCSPSGYEFAPSRACPSAPRSSPRPLSGVGAMQTPCSYTHSVRSAFVAAIRQLSSVAVSDRLGQLPCP